MKRTPLVIITLVLLTSCGSVHQYKVKARKAERLYNKKPETGITRKQNNFLNISLIVMGAALNHYDQNK